MKKSILIIMAMGMLIGQDITELFFSEYGEPDGGNHKYLEIYNGTGDVVSLDDVVILGNYNGNPWSETFTFQAGATVAAGDVYIVANSEADEAILALADETHAYGDPWYITSFNGDDVRALAQINGTETCIFLAFAESPFKTSNAR